MPVPAKTKSQPKDAVQTLDSVFDKLRVVLGRHAKPFTEHSGMVKNKRDYHLISRKPVVINGRKRKELYFASIIQQKNSVGFYFNRAYCENAPELLEHLDGKGCFHLKALTPGLEKEIDAALKVGLRTCRERKWI